MTTAQAVIGANWGDEGKGLAVDAIAARTPGATCVRTNGGAQAGHGVARPGGIFHVFHHVGAGTLAGAGTHLSRFFVAHPMVLGAELDALAGIGFVPRITVDPRALVTTPWDVALNQAAEIARGAGRHGSCGLGFGETIERSERGALLLAGDLWGKDLTAKLRAVTRDWLPERLAELGLDLDGLPAPLAQVLRSAGHSAFEADCAQFRNAVSLADDASLSGPVIFEAAQGLALDMDAPDFPHLTRSRTGIANMLQVADEAGIDHIDALYMTRAYATRHGAGPLPHEGTDPMPWLDMVDRTNATNPWQGALRRAPLDVDALASRIGADLDRAKGSPFSVAASIGVTCLDQMRGPASLMTNGRLASYDANTLTQAVSQASNLPIRLTSYGPEREDVMFVKSTA